MTTWTLDQIHAVRRLWAQITIDDLTSLAERVEIMAWARHEIAVNLADLAHPLAVEISEADVEFDEKPGPKLTTIVRGQWHPETRDVELVGGPVDGQIYTVASIWHPLRTASPRSTSLLLLAGDEAMPDVADFSPIITDYRLAGWREQERRWVFTSTGSL